MAVCWPCTIRPSTMEKWSRQTAINQRTAMPGFLDLRHTGAQEKTLVTTLRTTTVVSISLQYYDVKDPNALGTTVFPTLLDANANHIGSSNPIRVEWRGPILRSGMFESFVEWLGNVNVSSIPGATAANLIARYLWELISWGREGPLKTEHIPSETMVPGVTPFANALKIKMVITKQTKKIEIDALTIDHETLLLMLEKLLNAENSR